jgi:hypothetical protein
MNGESKRRKFRSCHPKSDEDDEDEDAWEMDAQQILSGTGLPRNPHGGIAAAPLDT